MTRYVLCRYAIRQRGEIEITEGEYLSLAADIKTLVEVCDAEEKFNALIDNYFELERGLLEEALRAMVYLNYGADDLLGPKNTINRRVINLLTSVKLYLDSYPQHANRLLVGNALEDLKRAPSRAYDNSLAYRVMEALRNYAQHEAFPIHGWTVSRRLDDSIEPNVHWASVNPTLDLASLAKAESFKKAVLKELQAAVGPLALKPFIREYIERLGTVHVEFRDATKALTAEALGRLKAAVDRFVAAFPGNSISVVALPVDERGIKAGEPVYLTAIVVEYLQHLQARVGLLANFSRRRVEY
jgi:hypothetical protein